ncbi:uncharacterized protein LOC135468877 isoform X2 [Liolophura sinensis]
MSSWARLEYNHGLAIRKWTEVQRGHLQYSDNECPEALRKSLSALVDYAERKAGVLMNIHQQIEDNKTMGRALVSYETHDFKPTMERLSKEMNYLVTTQRIREARSKREGKKYQESMKKIRDKEQVLADVTHAKGHSDIAIGRMSECQSQAMATLDRYITTIRKERSQRREFLQYAVHLQEMWSNKQRERLCLLLTSIQNFAKKIKSSDMEITKNPPSKQIKDAIKRADIASIVKDIESQYTKVHISSRSKDISSTPQKGFPLHHSSSAPRVRLEAMPVTEQRISPRKTVTLPNEGDAGSRSDCHSRVATFKKLDASPHPLTPNHRVLPILSRSNPSPHCESPMKETSCTPRLKLPLSVTSSDTTVLRNSPRRLPEISRLTPLDPITTRDETCTGEQGDIFVNHLTPSQTLATVVEEPDAQQQRSECTGSIMDDEDGRFSSPSGRPPTPVEQGAIRFKRSPLKTLNRVLLTPAGRLTPGTPRYTPDYRSLRRTGSKSMTPSQACQSFLKVSAAARKKKRSEIFTKNTGHQRVISSSDSTELESRALVLVRRPTHTGVRDKT